MKAPHFDLPGVDGKRHSPASARGKNGLQDVARAYDAVCTPDFYAFDADLELRYHGRLEELVRAMTDAPPSKPINSIGCSIKWK